MKSKILLVLSFTFNIDFWLAEEFRKQGYTVNVLANRYIKEGDYFRKDLLLYLRNIWGRFTLGWTAHKLCREEEKVIFWNWESVFLFVIRDYFTFRRCTAKIIALHLILLDTTRVKKIFWRYMFFLIKRHPNLKIAVNSEWERELYAYKYRIPMNVLIVLPDSFEYKDLPEQTLSNNISRVPHTVFCGGGSRDWETYFKIATRLPEYHFIAIVARKKFNDSLLVPENVELWFNTTTDFFYTKLYQSSVVCLPLSRKEACGLIVATKAAKLKVPLIVTDTPNMRNYIIQNENGIMVPMGDADGFARAIRSLENIGFRDKIVKQMSIDIEQYSPLAYALDIIKI